jgi:phosphatidylglycerol lysyltransferase
LQQRLRAAYVLTALLLGLGVVLAVSRGGGWGHALPSAVALALLLPCRQDFHRPASLVRERFTVPWSAAVAVVLVAAASLTLFSYRNVEFSSELWWRFALDGDAPRALRALMGGTAVAFLAAVAWLLRTAPPEPDPPTEAELDRAAEIAAVSPRAAAHIALLGDKRLLFNDRQDAFLMYAIEGRSWISVGEAVGAEQEIDELTWRFHSLSLAHGGRPVFYQVPEQGLHRYAELGLTLLKLGEAGRVPLEGFTLEGSARADLRQASRKVERAGCRFAVLPKEAVEPLLPRLRAISDAWLEGKNMPEKGFSLGFFHPAYLMRTPLAVVYRQIEGQVEGQAKGEPPGEEIVAFANILPGGEREECTVDLMRYTPAAPRGVMDYLFAQLMLWGAAEKFRWFSLGMAPLSGLRPETGPLWNRLGHLLFRHGEHFYNFQGLRQYKEKFNPVWSARYLATPGGLALPQILTDLTTLISRVPPEARDR